MDKYKYEGRIRINLPKDMIEGITKEAADRQVTVSEIVRNIIDNHLQGQLRQETDYETSTRD